MFLKYELTSEEYKAQGSRLPCNVTFGPTSLLKTNNNNTLFKINDIISSRSSIIIIIVIIVDNVSDAVANTTWKFFITDPFIYDFSPDKVGFLRGQLLTTAVALQKEAGCP